MMPKNMPNMPTIIENSIKMSKVMPKTHAKHWLWQGVWQFWLQVNHNRRLVFGVARAPHSCHFSKPFYTWILLVGMLLPLLFTLLASCLVDQEVCSKTVVFFRVKLAKQREDKKHASYVQSLSFCCVCYTLLVSSFVPPHLAWEKIDPPTSMCEPPCHSLCATPHSSSSWYYKAKWHFVHTVCTYCCEHLCGLWMCKNCCSQIWVHPAGIEQCKSEILQEPDVQDQLWKVLDSKASKFKVFVFLLKHKADWTSTHCNCPCSSCCQCNLL